MINRYNYNSLIKHINTNVDENVDKKMSEHIDFIENIYTNIKSPLGYLCNKINYFKQNDNKTYSLEYKEN